MARVVPGEWLYTISTGEPLAILDNVGFEIPGPLPLVIRAEAPSWIEAGQQLVVKINLDRFPTDLGPDCGLSLQVSLRGAQPGSAPSLGLGSSAISDVLLSPSRHSYEVSLGIAADAPAGAYEGVISASARPARATTKFCRALTVQGDTEFSFTVEPAAGLSPPIRLAGNINPSQVELLMGEAERLRAKAEHLRQQLSYGDEGANQRLLVSSLQEAVADVDRTEAKLEEKGKPPSAQEVNAFFDDIRFEYGEALKAAANSAAQLPGSEPRLDPVSAPADEPNPRLDLASKAVIASMVHNAKAYEVVASSEAITFNLEVFSEPKGAAISYRLRGENFHLADRATDGRIENLPRATYLIKLQKQGYEDTEVVFDAIYSRSTTIDVHLSPMRAAR